MRMISLAADKEPNSYHIIDHLGGHITNQVSLKKHCYIWNEQWDPNQQIQLSTIIWVMFVDAGA